MKQKSSIKPLILLIIICIVIFFGVVVFKNINIDNSEKITVIEPIKQTKKPKKSITKHAELKPYSDQKNEKKYKVEDIPNEIGKTINKQLMYTTPEKVVEAITYYQSIGNDKKAEEFIDYLLERFPDFDLE